VLKVVDTLPQEPLWKPHPGPQTQFLQSASYETLYGGQVGGGKTDALLVGALRHVHNPHYNAIIFRRTFPELERRIVHRARELYGVPFPEARYNAERKCWRFPSGATIYFGHLEHDASVYQHQSAEYQYLAFDELTSFTESQYRYMMSRARSAAGIPIQIRAGTNPGGEHNEWVFRRWGPWVDPQSSVKAREGRALWYLTESDGTDRWVKKDTPEALSRCFVASRLADNLTLMKNDPGYAARLAGLDSLARKQLLEGNWLARPDIGQVFSRTWFEIVNSLPPGIVASIRCWDRAATRPHEGNKDPDWTRGVKLCRTSDQIYYVEDVASLRERPHAVDARILNTARADGYQTMIGLFQDPGSAGVTEVDAAVRRLGGFNVRVLPQTSDKLTRARSVSAQAEAGNVKLVRGPWNEEFLRELNAFPTGPHDDIVDALSGAFNQLLPSTALERLRMLAQW
jgi:predicted phage terminase large subunit-like protein